MKLSDLVFTMRKRNIHFFLSNGKLKLKYPKEDDVSDLLDGIKSCKNELIQLIEGNQSCSIPKVNKKEVGGLFPISSRQLGLYFIYEADKKSIIYNVLSVCDIVGKLDINALNFSISNVIGCHDAYRTYFRLDENGNPSQVIHDEVQFNLDVTYASDKEVEKLILKEKGHPFDLTQAPLLRVKLFIVNENRYVLLFNHHHIITDFLSINMFMKNVFSCYEYYMYNLKIENSPSPIGYADFSVWDFNQLKGIAFQSRLKYWKRYLHDPFDCFLPNAINDSSLIMSKSSYVGFEFDAELLQSLLIFAKQEKTTLYIVLLSALYLVFGKFYTKKDLIISTQYANRDHPDLERVLGYFTTKLLIRNQLEDELSVSQFIKEVSRNFSVVIDNCVPYDYQVSVLREKGLLNISDFADVSLNLLLGNPSSIINPPGITINPYYDSVYNKFNTLLGGPSGLRTEGLGFTITYDNNEVYGCCSFSSALFSQHTVECIIKHYKYVLNQMISHPELLLKNITLLSPKEYHKVVYDWNKTEAPYPNGKTIHRIFEEQVAKTPNNIALVFEDERISYQTLNKKSNQLARFIRAQYQLIHDEPMRSDALITLCLERNFDMIVAILGVLKSGAAYVPINPEFPQSRIQFILNDTKSSMILTQSNLQEKLEQSLFSDDAKALSHSCRLIFLDNKPYAEEYQDNLQISSKSIDLAYIIYTSGTTGNPKGVMIEHRNIIVHAAAMAERLDIQSNDVFGTLSSPDVDSGNTAIYVVLLFGYTLSLIPKYCLLDVNKLINVVKRDKISFYKIVPTLLDGLLDNRNSIYDLRSLLPSKTLILGGSELKNELLDKIKRLNSKINIMNHYGPTEATVGAMTAFMNESRKIVIGTPLNNYSGYILDKYLNTLPIGAIGELYIGRAGLARGYLNQPELTQERFIENPFATSSDIEKGYTRFYKTGDLARWLPCGNIEYIGRNDFQVKMLGFRIELGEIESALLNIHGIKQSVVLAKCRELGGNQSQYLVAYYVADTAIDDEALLESLKVSLPDYMIPNLYVHLEVLPLTSNGKVDLKALPDTEFKGNLDKYEAPRNDLEKQLCDIWQNLLNIEQVGIHDNFFRLGGHSTLAIQLVHKIEQLCQKHVAVADIFKHKTIAQLASEIVQSLALVIPKTTQNPIPLSFAQERLWFIEQYEQGTNAYHMPGVYQLSPDTNLDALKQAFTALVERHEVLRTVFWLSEDNLQHQVILDESFTIEEHLVSSIDDLNPLIEQDSNKPFDLVNSGPLRVVLYQLEQAEDSPLYYILINTHHVASDGWSTQVFHRDLMAYYHHYDQGAEVTLPEMPIQYKDFAVWQRGYVQGDILEKQLSFWKEQLADYEPLNLPLDKIRPAMTDYAGANVYSQLNLDLSMGIREIAKAQGCSVYTVMLSAFYIMLSKWSGQEDITIGGITANRHYPGVQDLIGFFVNAQVLRHKLDANHTFEELLGQVQAHLETVQRYQDVPFEELLNELEVERDLSRHPLFQVCFSLQDFSDEGEQTIFKESDTILSSYSIAKFDLELFVSERSSEITLCFYYSASLFEEDTIKRVAGFYQRVIEQLVQDRTQSVKDISLLTDKEYQTIVYDWNKTDAFYSKDKTIHQLFEEQAERAPNNIALVFEDELMSYQVLNEKSNQLARHIREQYQLIHDKPLQPDTLITLCLERGFDMIIAILAVLKAGGAYVPIDPEYPEARIQFVIEDTQSSLLLTQSSLQEKIHRVLNVLSTQARVPIWLDQNAYQAQSSKELSPISQLTDLAYVIYTSGTTGKPKGVMIEHQSVINLTQLQKCYFSLHSGSRALQFSSLSFDASVFEIFVCLSSGSQLNIVSNLTKYSAKLLSSYIVKRQIDCVTLPAKLLPILGFIPSASLKTLVVAGEQCDKSIMDQWSKNRRLINAYGPTECTVCASMNEHSLTSLSSDIGQSVENAKLYILDRLLSCVPTGVTGELYIGGAGLARGYLNQPELTQERFIDNPFATTDDIEKGYTRLYKTGDLARWLPNGNIEYIGRNDFQVKIRGFRIELDEIESALLAIEGIKQSVVLAKNRELDGNHSQYLVAYYSSDHVIEDKILLESLKASLPDYMIPSLFVHLDELPLTMNGKLDRQALPDPEFKGNLDQYEAPRNDLEQQLCDIWQALLNLEQVGIHDDFFRLGGDSIISIQVVSRMQRAGYVCTIKDLFEERTIARLNYRIQSSIAQSLVKAEQGVLNGSFGLLPIQHRFFDLVSLDRYLCPHHYCQSFMIQVPLLCMEQLDVCLTALIQQHDALRLRFVKTDNTYHQAYCSEVELPIRHEVTVTGLSETDLNDQLTGLQSQFNYTDGPLWSVAYLTGYADGSARLWFAFHHLIIDAVSWRILKEDLEALYKGYALSDKTSSYRQWVDAVASYAKAHIEDIPYWQSQLADIPDYDHYMTSHRSQVNIEFSAELTDQLLHQVNAAYNTEINDLLLTALAYALRDWLGGDCHGVSLEGHGREMIDDTVDVGHTVGWFTTIFPVKLTVSDDIGASIQWIKESLREIPDKGLGYSALCQLDNALTLQALPGIVFNYLGQFDGKSYEDNHWSFSHEPSGNAMDQREEIQELLTINGGVNHGRLQLSILGRLGQGETNKFSTMYKDSLHKVISFCIEQVNSHRYELTPSDYWVNFEPYVVYGNLKSNKTLILCHPGEGGVESYLNTLCPYFDKGLKIILIDNALMKSRKKIQHDTFYDLAAWYLDQIPGIHLENQLIYTGGYSFGAMLAYEMIDLCHLKFNRPVKHAFLMDPPFKSLLSNAAIDETFYKSHKPKPVQTPLSVFQCQVIDLNNHYNPSFELMVSSKDMGLSAISNNYTIYPIKCAHYDLLNAEHAKEISAIINKSVTDTV